MDFSVIASFGFGAVLMLGITNYLQLRTIHKLVNSRLSQALAQISQLEDLLNVATARNVRDTDKAHEDA